MKQTRTTYEQDLEVMNDLRLQVKRALQKEAFATKDGTDDEQLFFDAVFSEQTKFSLDEATLLAFSLSNALKNNRENSTDNQVSNAVATIKPLLIERQKHAARPVLGLA